MSNDDTHKPWGGRFTEATNRFVEEYTASVGFDKRLYRHDIAGSIAHARMLAKVGVLSEQECQDITKGLESILVDIERGDFNWSVSLEDVHMNIEARLTDRIGDVGKKLHTARSRNDQVATDIRLYLRDEIDHIVATLRYLQNVLLDIAEREAGTIMPGFTHLQTAQPITFGHHMLAWYEMLSRDEDRMRDCRVRVNVMPLGSAALAGTSYPIDRHYTAELLGFDAVSENSLDAVSDRDFIIEFISAASLVMMHLSRFSEELILWSSAQFDFVDLGDSFCTGSSIMPQKKNPDVPEVVRGKTGRVYGDLIAMLTIMKAQPLAYNKDNQEDKEPLFDTVDTVAASLRLFSEMLEGMQIKSEHLKAAAALGYSTATDLADYLVRKGIPFRDAHEIVGTLVRECINADCGLAELPLENFQQHCDKIDSDVFEVLTLEGSVAARNHIGGTAPQQVMQAVKRARAGMQADG